DPPQQLRKTATNRSQLSFPWPETLRNAAQRRLEPPRQRRGSQATGETAPHEAKLADRAEADNTKAGSSPTIARATFTPAYLYWGQSFGSSFPKSLENRLAGAIHDRFSQQLDVVGSLRNACPR